MKVIPPYTQEQLVANAALLADAIAELRRLEWSIKHTPYVHCPSCDHVSEDGHAPNCTLAALLARAEPPGPRPGP